MTARERWLNTCINVLNELLNLLTPQEQDEAFEELVAKVRTKRAHNRSTVIKPIPRDEP